MHFPTTHSGTRGSNMRDAITKHREKFLVFRLLTYKRRANLDRFFLFQ